MPSKWTPARFYPQTTKNSPSFCETRFGAKSEGEVFLFAGWKHRGADGIDFAKVFVKALRVGENNALFSLIGAGGVARFGDGDGCEQGQFGFQAIPNPFGKDFAGGIFQALDFV